MSHLWDPLNVTVRPLLFYGATEAVGLLSHAVLLASGFRRHSHSHVGAAHYWVRRAGDAPPPLPPPPVEFTQGVFSPPSKEQ